MTSTWIPDDWTFESEPVANRFDNHVRETLPWYDLATHGTAHLVRAYLPTHGTVYDIGASTGNIGRAIANTLTSRSATLHAIEPAEQMAVNYSAPGHLHVADAATFEYEPFDIAVLFLVLMFIPPQQRTTLLHKLEQQLKPGGAIIIVDKTEAVHGYLGSTITRWTLQQKQLGGIKLDEIAAKELSLIGNQRPIKETHLHNYTCWLRVGEFAGFIHTNTNHL